MVHAVVLILSDSELSNISLDRYADIRGRADDFNGWLGVDYLILCTNFGPIYAAKIDAISISRAEGGMLRATFSELRSMAGKHTHPQYPEALKSYRYNGGYSKLLSFESEDFFTIGEHAPFIAKPDTLGPLSMSKATELLAQTYGVDSEQVEITIRSKPRLT